MDMNEDNRRQHARLKIDINVTWLSEHNFYTGLTVDICAGGLFIATGQLLDPGHLIDIKLALPSGAIIAAKGVVVWVREETCDNLPAGFGIQFNNLTPEQIKLINTYITKREPYFFE